MPYPGHSLGWVFYSPAEIPSAYSIALIDWDKVNLRPQLRLDSFYYLSKTVLQLKKKGWKSNWLLHKYENGCAYFSVHGSNSLECRHVICLRRNEEVFKKLVGVCSPRPEMSSWQWDSMRPSENWVKPLLSLNTMWKSGRSTKSKAERRLSSIM